MKIINGINDNNFTLLYCREDHDECKSLSSLPFAGVFSKKE